jgi:hypothetical protein
VINALKMIGMFWVALILTYGIIAVALIIIQAGLNVIRRKCVWKPRAD